jgi:hypothetical protein
MGRAHCERSDAAAFQAHIVKPVDFGDFAELDRLLAQEDAD